MKTIEKAAKKQVAEDTLAGAGDLCVPRARVALSCRARDATRY